MGPIFAFFQSTGKTPCEYDSWNICASGSLTTSALFCITIGCTVFLILSTLWLFWIYRCYINNPYCLSVYLSISSGPDDLSGFSLFNFFMTAKALNWILGMGLMLLCNVGLSGSHVKTSWNCLYSSSADSLSDFVVEPSSLRRQDTVAFTLCLLLAYP